MIKTIKPITNSSKFLIFSILLFLVIAIWSVVSIINSRNNLGLISFSIATLPEDSIIEIDGSRIMSKQTHLTPGIHRINIKRDGFRSFHTDIHVSPSNNWFFTTLQPQSKEAKKWYSDNITRITSAQPDLIESTYNNMASENPIVDYLPRTDIYGPYKIDYGFDSNLGHLYILISLSTPDGRQEAINWIRSLGIDPTSLDIRYTEGDVDGYEPPIPVYQQESTSEILE